MRETTITTQQKILNKCHSMVNFTFDLHKKSRGRYVVSIKNLYTGVNPSLDNLLFKKIQDVLNDTQQIDKTKKYKGVFCSYCSIGGWNDKNTGLYHVDANLHFYSLYVALDIAKYFNQLSVFDLEKNEVIYVSYD